MEFLLPSLLLLLAGAFIVFGIFPKLGPTTLVGLAVITLILVVNHHMTLFELEYKDLLIIDSLKKGAPTVLVVLTTLLIIGYFLLTIGFVKTTTSTGSSASSPPAAEGLIANATKMLSAVSATVGSKNNAKSKGSFFSKYV
jgi:hypothetical protein